MNSPISLLFLLLITISAAVAAAASSSPKTFNVHDFGAVSDNKTDNSKPFLDAWNHACQWRGPTRVFVPPGGTYYLTSAVFKGPCNGPIDFVIQGVLTSPTDPRLFLNIDHWISFQNIENLRIYGGGALDGQGAVAWPYNTCPSGYCKKLPVTLRLDFVNDSAISDLRSINSKNFHVNIFSCYRVNVTGVRLSAPGDSPNTDGIHVAVSGDVRIDSAEIGTGDDCVSIGPGCKGIHISRVRCGPGHGISVGSMGKSRTQKEVVSGVTVVNCTLTRTLNGVQIKTWPDSAAADGGYAADMVYEGIVMEEVGNPIFINQVYCPFNLCDPKESSKISIRNITYKDIVGTSTTIDAVKLNCSRSNPCKGIVLENIDIVGPSGASSMSQCSNAYGQSKGQQKPQPCLV